MSEQPASFVVADGATLQAPHLVIGGLPFDEIGKSETKSRSTAASCGSADSISPREPTDAHVSNLNVAGDHCQSPNGMLEHGALFDTNLRATDTSGRCAAPEGTLSEFRLIPASIPLASGALLAQPALGAYQGWGETRVTEPPQSIHQLRGRAALIGEATPPGTQIASACLKLGAAAGMQHATIALDPEELGRVTIRVQRREDGMLAVDLAAERPETVAQLQRDEGQIKAALAAGGSMVSQVSVSLRFMDLDASSLSGSGYGSQFSPGGSAGQHSGDQRQSTTDGRPLEPARIDTLLNSSMLVMLEPSSRSLGQRMLTGIDITA